MPLKAKTLRPIGNAEFRKHWKRLAGGNLDSWGCEYLYEFMAWRLWKAAIREQKRADNGGTARE